MLLFTVKMLLIKGVSVVQAEYWWWKGKIR